MGIESTKCFQELLYRVLHDFILGMKAMVLIGTMHPKMDMFPSHPVVVDQTFFTDKCPVEKKLHFVFGALEHAHMLPTRAYELSIMFGIMPENPGRAMILSQPIK